MQETLFASTKDDAAYYSNPRLNKLEGGDQPFHSWYRFVLSFPPHLVRHYLVESFGLGSGDVVLDPFCGTGTTAVEAKLLGLGAIGIEANPMAHFASTVKTNWKVSPHKLIDSASEIAADATRKVRRARVLHTLSDDSFDLLLRDSIDPVPLHKLLILKDSIEASMGKAFVPYGLLALAKTAVRTASNLHFGPEVGVRGHKEDAAVVEAWLAEVGKIALDVGTASNKSAPVAFMYKADARHNFDAIEPDSVAAVFTSPPYPNEKDYTRTTRLESVLLGFLKSRQDLRNLKHTLMRSNTRNVYKADQDHEFVAHNLRIQEIAREIEQRRVSLKKTSGFERLYARVTTSYFGGMARHLQALKPKLRKGAFLGYVVGDQASYFQVHIETGSILAGIAEELGYRHVRTDLFRTRLATATKKQMREEVVILQRL